MDTITTPAQATGEFKIMLVRLMTRQLYAETATAEVFGKAVSAAPTWHDKYLSAQFTAEEARHSQGLCDLLAELDEDPEAILQKTFEETEGYDEMVVLRGIRFESHCEHHLAPIIGRAWVGYIPNGRVVGISKLARVVNAFAKRLQIQEKMTSQIANIIDEVLKPQGVAIVIKAEHHCMTTRGVLKPGTDMVTSRMLGVFRDNALTRQEFLSMVGD